MMPKDPYTILWAVLFLPPYIMQLTNFVSSVLSWTGSGTISRLTICAFLGIQNLADPQRWKGVQVPVKLEKPEQRIQVFPTARVCPGLSGRSLKLSLRPLGAVFGAALLAIGH